MMFDDLPEQLILVIGVVSLIGVALAIWLR